MNTVIVLLIALGIFGLGGAPAARANGLGFSNGGDAIVCFPTVEAKDQSFDPKTQRLRPFALEQRARIFSLDYWLATQSKKGLLTTIEMTELEDTFDGRFPGDAPVLRANRIMEVLGLATGAPELLSERAIPDDWELTSPEGAGGVVDIADEHVYVNVPANCLLVQAAVRVGHNFYFDYNVVEALKTPERRDGHPVRHPDQLAFLLLHELIAKVMSEQGPCYESESVYRFTEELLVLLGEQDSRFVWIMPGFPWNDYLDRKPELRLSILKLLLRYGILTEERLRQTPHGHLLPATDHARSLCPATSNVGQGS